jgi:hypothetical protein
LTSFQEARLGLDQMVRDINDAGYPPPTFVRVGSPNFSVSSPFAWSPGYPGAPCLIATGGGGSCTTATAGDTAPGDFDLIIETNPDPATLTVQWIRYQLQGTTLMRSMVPKAAGADPDAATSAAGALAPFVQNVVNNVCPPQIPNCQAANPNLFPGGAPVPIFSYTCDTGNSPQPCPPLAAPNNSPANIREVFIRLIVAAPLPDATTQLPRLVMLTGRGRRVNPNK